MRSSVGAWSEGQSEMDPHEHSVASFAATHSRLKTSTIPYSGSVLFPVPPFLTGTFVLSNEYMFVQRNTSNSADYSSPLWVSRNRQSFRQARFPLRYLEKVSYSRKSKLLGKGSVGSSQ